MSLKDVQKEVDEWIVQYTEGYWKPHEILVRLMEEIGELSREVNHIYGPKKKKSTEEIKEMKDEIADILFTLSCLANSLNIDLDEAFKESMKKYHSRDKDRWEKR
ncbi:MAG: nucleotide pyrophosphohydrolase [Candidatus Woesearchaeota archaeon]